MENNSKENPEHTEHKVHEAKETQKTTEKKHAPKAEHKTAKMHTKKKTAKSAEKHHNAKSHVKPVHKKHEINSKTKPFAYERIWQVGFIILAILVVFLLLKNNSTDTTTSNDKVKLDFYVMSQCPYGTQVEQAMTPVMKKMGDVIEYNVEYIVSEVAPGNFQSLHGEPEVLGNIVQLCVNEHSPDAFIDFLECQNENAGAIPGNWESCVEGLDIDKETIQTCYDGEEGKTLLSESAKKAKAVNAQGSPTIFINDEPYNSGRDSDSFMRAVCANVEHEECANIPVCAYDMDCEAGKGMIPVCENAGTKEAVCSQKEAVKFEMIVLNDKTCTTCDTTQIIEVLSQTFAGMTIKELDVNSEEGKSIVTELNLTYAPAYVVDKAVTETYAWTSNAQLQQAFVVAGDKLRIVDEATGATHFIDEEKRIALLEEIGVTLGDNKPQIDFFVMSYCPYGNDAEEIVDLVYQNLGSAAEFNPKYVIYSNYQGGGPTYCLDDESLYCSMHGVQEVNQDVREICVNNHMGIDSWFAFVKEMNDKCDYTNADTCWEPVAEELGLDVEVIKTCFDTEATTLLAKELELNKKLGVSGSPTIFIEGNKYEGARSANDIQKALCNGFENKPASCSKTVGEPTQQAQSGSC